MVTMAWNPPAMVYQEVVLKVEAIYSTQRQTPVTMTKTVLAP